MHPLIRTINDDAALLLTLPPLLHVGCSAAVCVRGRFARVYRGVARLECIFHSQFVWQEFVPTC